MNARLGKSKAHPNLKRIEMNLRTENEEGLHSVMTLTEKIGVYIVGFIRGNVCHFCVVSTRRSMKRVVIDGTDTFSLEANTWMNTSQFTHIHEVAIA